jgi:hypothetical protein
MSLNLLEHVAFAYQPVWGASRQLIGVRLRVRALAPDSVDAAHLLELLANAWSGQAPFLLVSFVEQSLLRQTGPYFPYFDLARRLELDDEVQRLPAVCEAYGFPLEQLNRALLRTLAQWRNSL